MKTRETISLAAALTTGMVTLGLVVAAGAPTDSRAQPPADRQKTIRSLPQDNTFIYLPLILKPIRWPVSLANGSFEADTVVNFNLPWPYCRYTGFTDQPKGNQHPSGWTYYSPASGETLPFATKMQQGSMVPAISGGPGEYVHKCTWM